MRRLGFASDAGYRFERGVDFELPPRAVERATELMLAICGGRAGPLSDVKATAARARRRCACAPRASRGCSASRLSTTQIADVFTRLGFAFTRDGDDFVVTPPSYRFDLAIEEDFVEEVARIHGYDVDSRRDRRARHSTCCRVPDAQPSARRRCASGWSARDWQEIVTFGFVDVAVEARARSGGARRSAC